MAKTLQDILDAAMELADFTEDDDFIDEASWITWINQGITELQRIIANANPDQFFTTVDFTLSGTNEYTLPVDFVAIRGLTVNPGLSNRMTVHRFNFGERDQGRSTFAMFSGLPAPRQYRVVSKSKLLIEPQESAAGTYRLYYVASPTVLAQETSRSIEIDTGDTALNDGGFIQFSLTNGAFSDADVGAALTIDWNMANDAFDVTSAIITAKAPGNDTTVTVDAAWPGGSLAGPASGTASLLYQPADTSNELDAVLEPYWEYVAIVTAIKAVAKEEGDTNDLLERRNVMRQDIVDSAGNDDNEPNGIVDVQDGGGGLGWL